MRGESWGVGGEVSVWLPPGGKERLQQVTRHAWEHSPAQRDRLAAAGVDPAAVQGPADLQAVPVLRKEHLGPLQAQGRPFGGLLGQPTGHLARIFLSPGDIFDPQGARPDYWRFGPALAAAGFQAGDVVMNCFNYHLSPAGFMFDDAARSQGCVVIPAGVGQQDLQVQVLAETRATGYAGLPSYLLALLEKAAAAGKSLHLQKALVTAEPLPPSLRAKLAAYGVDVYQCYGTADLGSVAYECREKQGMHLDDGVVLELCDPEGRPVVPGAVGEIVVTLLDPTYPLFRFGTGDLSALMMEPCLCGRTVPRIRGWLGRANDVVKVRGMFIYPRQIEEALATFPGQVARWQAVVDRDEHHRDRLTVNVEPAPGAAPDPALVADKIRAVTRLSVAVAMLAAGALPADAGRLEDRRQWE